MVSVTVADLGMGGWPVAHRSLHF